MAMQRKNRKAQMNIYKSSEVSGVSFYNQAVSDGGPSAKIIAIIGKPENLERVGHYGFKRFRISLFYCVGLECWAKTAKHAKLAVQTHYEPTEEFIVGELTDDGKILPAA